MYFFFIATAEKKSAFFLFWTKSFHKNIENGVNFQKNERYLIGQGVSSRSIFGLPPLNEIITLFRAFSSIIYDTKVRSLTCYWKQCTLFPVILIIISFYYRSNKSSSDNKKLYLAINKNQIKIEQIYNSNH